MVNPKPLRRLALPQTKDKQRNRRAGKRFDSLGRENFSTIELSQQITVQQGEIDTLTARITELESAIKALGEA